MALIAWTSEVASQSELETLLATWAMLAHDVDRGVTTVGTKSWADFVTTTPGQDEHRASSQSPRTRFSPKLTLTSQLLISLFKFVQHIVLDPQDLHTTLNPAPVVPPVASPPQQGRKGAPQGKGATQGKKGSPIPQKKSGRYVPPPPDSLSPPPSSMPDGVGGESNSEENDSDRAGRLRVGALGVVRWILGTLDLSLFGSR